MHRADRDLRSGRRFNGTDAPGSPRVAIISESLASRLFPGVEANGRTVMAAGILFAMLYGVVLWNMGFLAGMKAFTAAVLGGIGNIPGAMLGGLLLGLVETFGAGYLPFITAGVIGPEYKDIFAFLILILVLVFRPMGILGERVAR